MYEFKHRRSSLYSAIQSPLDEEELQHSLVINDTSVTDQLRQLIRRKQEAFEQQRQERRSILQHVLLNFETETQRLLEQRRGQSHQTRVLVQHLHQLQHSLAQEQAARQNLAQENQIMAQALQDLLNYQMSSRNETSLNLFDLIQKMVGVIETLQSDRDRLQVAVEEQGRKLIDFEEMMARHIKLEKEKQDMQVQEWRTYISDLENGLDFLQHQSICLLKEQVQARPLAKNQTVYPFYSLTHKDASFQYMPQLISRLLMDVSVMDLNADFSLRQDMPKLSQLDLTPTSQRDLMEVDRLLVQGKHLSKNSHLFSWNEDVRQLKQDLEKDLERVGLRLYQS